MNHALAACLLALAGSAHASRDFDCRHFDRGHEILGNITERFYGANVAKEQLHAWVLKLTREDADAANHIAAANALNGEDCSAVNAARAAMTAKYNEVIKLVDAARPACTTYPNKMDQVGNCEAKTRPLYKADDAAGLLAAKFVAAAAAHPTCTSLDFNDEAKTSSDTPEAVFLRIQKKACKRDDRCHMVRVGKIREARGEFHRIEQDGKDAAPADLLGAWGSAKPLLFKQDGEATNESSPENGAENILWHMEVFNDNYGGQSDDDTNLIFVASGKVAAAELITRAVLCKDLR